MSKKFDHVLILADIYYKNILNDLENDQVTLCFVDFSLPNIEEFIFTNYYEIVKKKNVLWLVASGILSFSNTFVNPECYFNSCSSPLLKLRDICITDINQGNLIQKYILDIENMEKKLLAILHKSCNLIMLPLLPSQLLNCDKLSHTDLHHLYCNMNSAIVAEESNLDGISYLCNSVCNRMFSLIEFNLRRQNIDDSYFLDYVNKIGDVHVEEFCSLRNPKSHLLKSWYYYTNFVILKNLNYDISDLNSNKQLSKNYNICDINSNKQLSKKLSTTSKKSEFYHLIFIGPAYLINQCKEKYDGNTYFIEENLCKFDLNSEFIETVRHYPNNSLFIILVDISLVTRPVYETSFIGNNGNCVALHKYDGEACNAYISKILKEFQDKIDTLRKYIPSNSAMVVSPIYSSIGLWVDFYQRNDKLLTFYLKKNPWIYFLFGPYNLWFSVIKILKIKWKKFMIDILKKEKIRKYSFTDFVNNKQNHVLTIFSNSSQIQAKHKNECNSWNIFLENLKTYTSKHTETLQSKSKLSLSSNNHLLNNDLRNIITHNRVENRDTHGASVSSDSSKKTNIIVSDLHIKLNNRPGFKTRKVNIKNKLIITHKDKGKNNKTVNARIKDNEKSINKNIGKSISKNIEIGISKNIGKNISKNIENAISKNIGKSISKNIENGISKNIENGISKNIGKSISKNIEIGINKNIEKGISKNIGKSISKNIGKSISKNIGKNINKNNVKRISKDVDSYCNRKDCLNLEIDTTRNKKSIQNNYNFSDIDKKLSTKGPLQTKVQILKRNQTSNNQSKKYSSCKCTVFPCKCKLGVVAKSNLKPKSSQLCILKHYNFGVINYSKIKLDAKMVALDFYTQQDIIYFSPSNFYILKIYFGSLSLNLNKIIIAHNLYINYGLIDLVQNVGLNLKKTLLAVTIAHNTSGQLRYFLLGKFGINPNFVRYDKFILDLHTQAVNCYKYEATTLQNEVFHFFEQPDLQFPNLLNFKRGESLTNVSQKFKRNSGFNEEIVMENDRIDSLDKMFLESFSQSFNKSENIYLSSMHKILHKLPTSLDITSLILECGNITPNNISFYPHYNALSSWPKIVIGKNKKSEDLRSLKNNLINADSLNKQIMPTLTALNDFNKRQEIYKVKDNDLTVLLNSKFVKDILNICRTTGKHLKHSDHKNKSIEGKATTICEVKNLSNVKKKKKPQTNKITKPVINKHPSPNTMKKNINIRKNCCPPLQVMKERIKQDPHFFKYINKRKRNLQTGINQDIHKDVKVKKKPAFKNNNNMQFSHFISNNHKMTKQQTIETKDNNNATVEISKSKKNAKICHETFIVKRKKIETYDGGFNKVQSTYYKKTTENTVIFYGEKRSNSIYDDPKDIKCLSNSSNTNYKRKREPASIKVNIESNMKKSRGKRFKHEQLPVMGRGIEDNLEILYEKHLKQKHNMLNYPENDPEYRLKYKIFTDKYKHLHGENIPTDISYLWDQFWKMHVDQMMEKKWQIKIEQHKRELGSKNMIISDLKLKRENSFDGQNLKREKSFIGQNIQREKIYDRANLKREKSFDSQLFKRDQTCNKPNLKREKSCDRPNLKREKSFDSQIIQSEKCYDRPNLKREKSFDSQNTQREKCYDRPNLKREKSCDGPNLKRERSFDCQSLKREKSFDSQILKRDQTCNKPKLKREKSFDSPNLKRQKNYDSYHESFLSRGKRKGSSSSSKSSGNSNNENKYNECDLIIKNDDCIVISESDEDCQISNNQSHKNSMMDMITDGFIIIDEVNDESKLDFGCVKMQDKIPQIQKEKTIQEEALEYREISNKLPYENNRTIKIEEDNFDENLIKFSSNGELEEVATNLALKNSLSLLKRILPDFPNLLKGFVSLVDSFDNSLSTIENIEKIMKCEENKLLFLIIEDLIQTSFYSKYAEPLKAVKMILSFAE